MKCNLKFFKPNGQFYTEEDIETNSGKDKFNIKDIIDIRTAKKFKEITEADPYFILVTPENTDIYPTLIKPAKAENDVAKAKHNEGIMKEMLKSALNYIKYMFIDYEYDPAVEPTLIKDEIEQLLKGTFEDELEISEEDLQYIYGKEDLIEDDDIIPLIENMFDEVK